MSDTIRCNSIAASSKDAKFQYYAFDRRAVGDADVHIKVAYSGICHSDIHTVKGEWGEQKYPLCVGHEIIGTVVSVGKDVTKFKAGDKVGVGCLVGSTCNFTCYDCKNHEEQYCAHGFMGTYGTKVDEKFEPEGQTMGGYSSDMVINEKFVLSVPDNLFCAEAAPLLCAGITCYSPFQKAGMKAGDRVGIVGLGGLGHLGLKIAKAMGCHVTVISRSKAKEELARKLGADDYLVSTDVMAMLQASRSLNFIYDSIAFKHDVEMYIELLKPNGTIMMIGGIPEKMGVSSFAILMKGIKIMGSLIGGLKQTQEMLDFCSKHNVKANIELIDAKPENVEAAYKKVEASKVMFRAVIDTGKTMPKPKPAAL